MHVHYGYAKRLCEKHGREVALRCRVEQFRQEIEISENLLLAFQRTLIFCPSPNSKPISAPLPQKPSATSART